MLEFARDEVCYINNSGPAYPFDPEIVGPLRELMEEEECRSSSSSDESWDGVLTHPSTGGNVPRIA